MSKSKNRIIEILLKLKSNIKGAEDATAAIDKTTEAAERGAKTSQKAAEEQRAAVEALPPAYDTAAEAATDASGKASEAGREAEKAAEEQRGAVDTLPPAYEKTGAAAENAGKKAKKAGEEMEDSANKAPTRGRKMKVLGDALRHIANLNFSAAGNSLRQLGTGMDMFVGVIAVAITAVRVWLKNIRDWVSLAKEVKNNDLSELWANTVSSTEAAAASFERLRDRAAAAWEEILKNRDADDALRSADRKLTLAELEAERDMAIAGTDDPSEKRRIKEAHDSRVDQIQKGWDVRDAERAVARNEEDVQRKREQAEAARERVRQNKKAFDAITRQQELENREIGEMEGANPIWKGFKDIWWRKPTEERFAPHQKRFEEGSKKKDELLRDSRKALEEAAALDAEADRIENKRGKAREYDLERTKLARQTDFQIRNSSSHTTGDAVNELAAASSDSSTETVSALRAATDQIRRQQGEIAQLKEQLKNLPLD